MCFICCLGLHWRYRRTYGFQHCFSSIGRQFIQRPRGFCQRRAFDLLQFASLQHTTKITGMLTFWVCVWCTHRNTCFFCCQWWLAPLNRNKLTMSRSHWKTSLPTLRDTSNWVGLASHPGLQLYLSPLHVLEIRDTHCPEGATSRLALPQSELSGNSVVLFLSTLRPQPELP